MSCGVRDLFQEKFKREHDIIPDTSEYGSQGVDLIYHLPDERDTEKIEEVLGKMLGKGHIRHFSLEMQEDPEEEEQDVSRERLEQASEDIEDLLAHAAPLLEHEESLRVAAWAIQQMIGLSQSSAYPFPLVELPCAPSLLFPIANTEQADHTLWLEVSRNVSALTIIIHKEKPTITDASQSSRATAMAGVQIDYHVAEDTAQEIVQVFLQDEAEGPYGEPHWDHPEVACKQESPIILVEDVQNWQP
jgi:hypothetical protein